MTAFREFKPDLLQKAQGDRYLRRLEPSIAHLAKTLRIPGDESIFEDASQGDYDYVDGDYYFEQNYAYRPHSPVAESTPTSTAAPTSDSRSTPVSSAPQENSIAASATGTDTPSSSSTPSTSGAKPKRKQ